MRRQLAAARLPKQLCNSNIRNTFEISKVFESQRHVGHAPMLRGSCGGRLEAEPQLRVLPRSVVPRRVQRSPEPLPLLKERAWKAKPASNTEPRFPTGQSSVGSDYDVLK